MTTAEPDVRISLGFSSKGNNFGKANRFLFSEDIFLEVHGKKIAVPESIFWNKKSLEEFINAQVALHLAETKEHTNTIGIYGDNVAEVEAEKERLARMHNEAEAIFMQEYNSKRNYVDEKNSLGYGSGAVVRDSRS